MFVSPKITARVFQVKSGVRKIDNPHRLGR